MIAGGDQICLFEVQTGIAIRLVYISLLMLSPNYSAENSAVSLITWADRTPAVV